MNGPLEKVVKVRTAEGQCSRELGREPPREVSPALQGRKYWGSSRARSDGIFGLGAPTENTMVRGLLDESERLGEA